MTAPTVALVTATVMPRPDPESGLLVDALRAIGVETTIRAWDAAYDWAQVPLVVCRTPWDYSDRPVEFLDWARGVAARTELVNPIEVLDWNAHKSYLVDLAGRGVPVVPTTLVSRGAGQSERARALAGLSEVVIKPAVSGGARGALRVPAAAVAAAEHLNALSAAGDALVQPFIEAVQQQGESSLVYVEGAFSHAARKLPARGDYRVHEHHGGTVRSHEPTVEELAAAQRALDAAPSPTLYARIDLVESADGPLVMEAEMIDPEMFLGTHPGAAERYAGAIAARAADRLTARARRRS